MKRNSTILEVYNQNNKLEKIEVLKYFTLKQDNGDYIIYRPITENVNKRSLIFSAKLQEMADTILLMPIEDKKIKELIKDIIEKQFNEGKNDE